MDLNKSNAMIRRYQKLHCAIKFSFEGKALPESLGRLLHHPVDLDWWNRKSRSTAIQNLFMTEAMQHY
jgi:hypothetical protein